ncbi:hypothetical protein BDN72DRAFT_804461 [Pluteus cervinus]|uniref:Uncharacterized protein n=1 Tax=Pluteus cervinus TaxID=181527 RepID=A0ACD3A8Y0_9AGAR|nr:hypothetical protein BDN72DRAFT_804461 [Pluteus cervinus]
MSNVESNLSSSREPPPGISGQWVYANSGNDDQPWLSLEPIKYYTDAYIIQDNKILLGYKKRGFGKDMYNGFGGKVEPGETSLEAANRELQEEAGIEAPLRLAGSFLFLNEGDDHTFHIDLYRADEYTGTISETDEMRPEWFAIPPELATPQGNSNSREEVPPIPYDEMWGTDHQWLPFLMAGTPFIGRADFIKEGTKFVPKRWWFGTRDSL